jgi:hypothetical protein
MKIKQITLGRTVSTEDYESVRFALTAEVEANETVEAVWKALQKEVDSRETKLRREYKCK